MRFFTASFFVNTDVENNQIASFYSGAMAYAKDYSLADVMDDAPDLVIVSPNDPTAMSSLAQECRDRNLPFIYDPSQQAPRLSGEELYRDMQGAYAMIVNGYEIEVICQKTGQTLQDVRDAVEILVVTQGKDGSRIYTDSQIIHVPAFPVDQVVDPTGGGDAFRAGFVYGLASGWDLRLAGMTGSLCAAYALGHMGTQNHRFTPRQFVDRFRTAFDDEGALNDMLRPKGRRRA